MSMTIDEMIAVLKAAKRGEPIQCLDQFYPEQGWRDLVAPGWDFYRTDFRVKPKPREWWVNFYDLGPILHRSKLEAETLKDAHRTECVHVREVLEGEQ